MRPTALEVAYNGNYIGRGIFGYFAFEYKGKIYLANNEYAIEVEGQHLFE